MERSNARLWITAVAFAGILASALVLYRWHSTSTSQLANARVVEVLATASFINTWGPGPEIAKRFEARTGIHVVYHDGEDAGLLLKKLKLFPSDVVLGLDQFMLSDALHAGNWKVLNIDG